MDLKGDKGAEPTLPQVVTTHKRPPPRFRKLWTRVGVALSLSLLYDLSLNHSKHSLQVARTINGWKHSCSGSNKSFDNCINRVEDAFLEFTPLCDSPSFSGLSGRPSAKDVLSFFQSEFGISPSFVEPIFDAGSPESRSATLSTTSELKSPNAWIDVYYPMMNIGNADGISLEILGQHGQPIWIADLLEDGDLRDETAAKYKHAIPPWHGYSAAGQAAGPIVYANYGTKDDYDKFEVMGVDLTGKIVLARYGANLRGLQLKGAEDRGAVGILIYSDPRDDGVVVAENGYLPYPAGPARNPTSIQRGSVEYMSTYPGDSTTSGYPANENATRFEHELGGVAEGRKLDGKVGNHVVKMANDVDMKVMPIWNTMAAIPGHIKDEVVVLGCHRDAWVMGGADPISGAVYVLEVVRGLGALVRQGWKPLRTLIIASWDAEEYGLVGSTEWGEDFAQWIQDHAVSYVNVDIAVAGSRYSASGSPSLLHLIKHSAQDVAHPPEPGKTVWDALHDSGPYTGEQDADFASMWAAMNQTRARAASEDDVRNVAPLGTGSDYTVFLQRLGGFTSTPTDPPYHYHSIYDSQMWQETYADPGFHRHVETLGLLTLRLLNSIILPLNNTEYALQLDSYVDTLRDAISELQQASTKLDVEKLKAKEAFRKTVRNFPHKQVGHRVVHRIIKWVKRYLGIGIPLPDRDNVELLKFPSLHVLSTMEDVTDGSRCKGPPCNLIEVATRVKKVNQKLAMFERGFISEEGVKNREWYKHLGVAPGMYLGYGATTFPALTEAILYEQNVTLVEYEVTRLTTLLIRLAQDIEPRCMTF
ncbi:hypothetical protein V8E55_001993 [Tylopilus felleus]